MKTIKRGVKYTFLFFTLVLIVLLGFSPNWQYNHDKGIRAHKAGDYSKAIKELTPLAEQGVSGAQYNLGALYNNGQGVPQDYAEALKWY